MADEKINLQELTQRELLILLHQDVKELKADVAAVQKEQHSVALKVNTIETRSKVWGAIAGFCTALVAAIGERIINK